MTRAEIIFRLHSDQWSEYQKVYDALSLEHVRMAFGIADLFWRIHNTEKKEGWSIEAVTPSKTNEFGLTVKLSKIAHRELKPEYYDEYDGGMGYYSAPDWKTNPVYEYNYLEIPQSFIDGCDFRKRK